MRFSEEASSYPCVSRVVKFRLDVVYPVNSLGGPECGLYLIPLADGPLLVLSVAVVFILGRSSKRVVVTVNMTILVLHVGILLDGLDGLLIAQPLNMLHYQSAENHASGLLPAS